MKPYAGGSTNLRTVFVQYFEHVCVVSQKAALELMHSDSPFGILLEKTLMKAPFFPNKNKNNPIFEILQKEIYCLQLYDRKSMS